MRHSSAFRWVFPACLLAVALASCLHGQTNPDYKNRITFPTDVCAYYANEGDSTWVKFTILPPAAEPNVYFQYSKKYAFHYNFAIKFLQPFIGMTLQQFNAATLYSENQQAVLGTVILPPTAGTPAVAQFNEYGIQFVRQDPYSREQIRDMFNLVKSRVDAPADVTALYFPTYEQQAAAQVDRDWFASQGIELGSTARWAQGNACYSEGWALGRLNYIPADQIAAAYHAGRLEPNDILLTDGIPAEVPFVAGIVSLAPCTPNSHVAILARSYAVPFVYMAVTADAQRAQQLAGHRVVFSAYSDQLGAWDIRLLDTNDILDDATAAKIADLKTPVPLNITPMASYGAVGVSTDGLTPADAKYFGGKAANSGILRQAVPDNSPKAIALSFDLWNAFLDLPLQSTAELVLKPGRYMLFWADDDQSQGPTHTGFALSRGGESVALFAADGATLIDSVRFDSQDADVSYGRTVDGGATWQSFTTPTPGQANSADAGPGNRGLVINEIMAANGRTIEDPCEPGEYPDWIELYNASGNDIVLNGLYLTDDVNRPTKWQIPPATHGRTLREEIAFRLAGYDSYPPRDLQALATDLATIRSLFTNDRVTPLDPRLRDAVVGVLSDSRYGFDATAKLRFRSSTNVEDSDDFVGAGMYDSFSGCLADDLDDDTSGPCGCDPNGETEDGAFDAIRRAFASFYNDNAFLERLRRDVNEANVGMALLVHHSFPDEIELANGVATIERKTGANTIVTLVTQSGAVSVTNPEGGFVPEQVVAEVLSTGYVKLTPASIQCPSSLVPVGRNVMDWPADYKTLIGLLMKVSDKFGQVTGKTEYTLDLEYKELAAGGRVMPAGGMVIKQVRQVPISTRMQEPFLLNTPMEFEVYTGEFDLSEPTDVFANHRLKSRWTLETRSMTLDSNSLAEGLYGKITVEYMDDDQIRTISGEMSLLPSADHTLMEDNVVIDSWGLADLSNARTYHLNTTGIPTAVAPDACPVLTLSDLGTRGYNIPFRCLKLNVEHAQAVTSWYQDLGENLSSGLRTTTRNQVYLWPRTPASDADVPQERVFSAGGISIRTGFYYAAPPEGQRDWVADAGATAPLKRWGRTTIEGLTTEPIVLEGYYSQTYRPEHHNFVENFLFEPRMEPGMPQDILRQLSDRNIRFIHMLLDHRTNVDESMIATYGF